MAEQRLLERLRMDERISTAGNSPYELQIKSILAHIHNILCTRRGTVLIDDDYGMPDVFFSQGIRFQESTNRMSDAILYVIQKFEPRLKNITIVQLSQKDELLKQRFGLRGYLTNAPSVLLEFEVSISSEAKITVSLKNEYE